MDTLVTHRLAAYHSKQVIRVIDWGEIVIKAEGDSSGKPVLRWGVRGNVIPLLNQPANLLSSGHTPSTESPLVCGMLLHHTSPFPN